MTDEARAQTPFTTGSVRRVASGAITYAAAAILQRATPLLLLPLFTRILTPAEFGQVGVLTTLAAAITVLVGMGLESAVFRGYLRAADGAASQRAFVATVGGFVVVSSITVSVITAVALAPALAPVFSVPTDAFRFAAVGAALMSSSILVPLALLRAQERLRDYLQLTGLQVVVTPVLTILFVAGLGWGATGWMLAYMLSSAILLARGLAMIRRNWVPELDLAHLRRALAFGIPLMPHAAAHWGLSVSDRAILGVYVPASDVGAYYAAYVISLPVTLVAVSLSQATQPLYVEASASRDGRARLIGVITAHVLLVVLLAAAVAILGPSIQSALLPPAYRGAADLVPWLAAGAGLFGLYLVPMNVITMMVGRTSRVWVITVLAAFANLGLNFALVPRIGTLAAAVNTTVGYGLLLIGVFLYARRVCQPPLEYEVGRISAGVVMIGVPAVAAALLVPADTIVGLLIRAVILVAVAGAMFALGPLNGPTLRALRAWDSARETGRT